MSYKKIAVMYPGSRVDRITKPLDKSNLDYEVMPSDFRDIDAILLDCPSKNIVKEIFLRKIRKIPIIYRLRGDMLRAFKEMNQTNLKYEVTKWSLERVDGLIAIDPILKSQYQYMFNIPDGYAHTVGLGKNPKNYPTVNHKSNNLGCLSISNFNYYGKIRPMIDFAPYINEYLERNGGYWQIFGSEGKYSDYFISQISPYNKITYYGYTENPKEKYKQSNLFLHFSNFDSFPNVILEAMASNLPVITNHYRVFSDYNGPIMNKSVKGIQNRLQIMENPNRRKQYGKLGQDYLYKNHSYEMIGEEYSKFFRRIL